MLQRATSIFAFAICFFSCVAQSATQSPSTPSPVVRDISDFSSDERGTQNTSDLAITNLFLNQKKLSVTLTNLKDSSIPLAEGSLKIAVDGTLKENYPLIGLSDQFSLPARGSLTLVTPLTLVGRHEVSAYVEFVNEERGSDKKGNGIRKILEGPPVGPDVVVKNLDLTEDLELMIILSNAGEVDLHKGAIFQIQIFVNGQKNSEFDHFISNVLRSNFGNRYAVTPPYRVGIIGISNVKVSISPEFPSDDICSENNSFEKTFIIFPFKIAPKDGEEFTFSISPPSGLRKDRAEKLKAEARWEGAGTTLMISFKLPGGAKEGVTLSGRSPLKAEIPITFEEIQKEEACSVLLTNPAGKKIGGYLIIQPP